MRVVSPSLFIGLGELGKETISYSVRSINSFGKKFLNFNDFLVFYEGESPIGFFSDIITFLKENKLNSPEENFRVFKESIYYKLEKLRAVTSDYEDIKIMGVEVGASRDLFLIFLIDLDEDFGRKYFETIFNNIYFKNTYNIYLIKSKDYDYLQKILESIKEKIDDTAKDEGRRKKIFVFSHRSSSEEIILETQLDWVIFFKEIIDIYYYADLKYKDKQIWYLHDKPYINTIAIKSFTSYSELFYHYYTYSTLSTCLLESIKPLELSKSQRIQDKTENVFKEEMISKLNTINFQRKLDLNILNWQISKDPTVIEEWHIVISKIDSIIEELKKIKSNTLNKLKEPGVKYSYIAYQNYLKIEEIILNCLKDITKSSLNGLRECEFFLNEINNYIVNQLNNIQIDLNYKKKFNLLFEAKIKEIESLKSAKYIPFLNKSLYKVVSCVTTILFSLSLSLFYQIKFLPKFMNITDFLLNWLINISLWIFLVGGLSFYKYKKILLKIEREKEEFLSNLEINLKGKLTEIFEAINKFGDIIRDFWKKQLLISLKKENSEKINRIKNALKLIENTATYYKRISDNDKIEIDGGTKVSQFIISYDPNKKNFEFGEKIQNKIINELNKNFIPFPIDSKIKKILGWSQTVPLYLDKWNEKIQSEFTKLLNYKMDFDSIFQENITISIPWVVDKTVMAQLSSYFLTSEENWKKAKRQKEVLTDFVNGTEIETCYIPMHRQDKFIAAKIAEEIKFTDLKQK